MRERSQLACQPKLCSRDGGPPSRRFHLSAAMADSLREKPERTLVSRIFASWNQLDEWLRQIEGLRFVA